MTQAAIYGLAGLVMSADERAFFRDARPAGYIVFRRNIESREQLRALTDSLRDLEGHDEVPILIDQEGGRVARMRPPIWPTFPSGEAFDRLYQVAPSSAIEAARVNARALGLMLHEVGVTIDCLPMLDVRQPGATWYRRSNASPLGKAGHSGGRMRATRPPSWSIRIGASCLSSARSESVSARSWSRLSMLRRNRM